jgi:hypothetical protein
MLGFVVWQRDDIACRVSVWCKESCAHGGIIFRLKAEATSR